METMLQRGQVRAAYMRRYEENKAEVDARIADGIERFRKGNAHVRFVNEQGIPQTGKKVKVTQLTHDFKIGANLFLLDEFPTEAENAAYRKLFQEHFNMATLPFYWNALEPHEGHPRFAADSEKIYRRPAPDLCMDYCEKTGVTPKLHCLFYDKFAPDWLKNADLETAKAKLEKRIAEIAERYRGRMFEFEVTNELFCVWDRQTVLTRWKDIVPWCFEVARKYFPDDRLTINEGNSLLELNRLDYYSPYYLQCKGLLDNGVSIDRIGLQNHQFTGVSVTTQEEYDREVLHDVIYNDPQTYFHALDVMAELGKPLEITEITVPTFGTSPEDEELQADMLKLWLSVFFAHPAVDAAIYWNTVDGCTFAAPGWNENNCRGGLWRRDMTPKKAALTLYKLFHEDWHTELELVTDENGYVDFRGFYGTYTIEAAGVQMPFELHK